MNVIPRNFFHPFRTPLVLFTFFLSRGFLKFIKEPTRSRRELEIGKPMPLPILEVLLECPAAVVISILRA